MKSKFCELRFRNNDGIHHKGDVQFVHHDLLYVGQTADCELKLPVHPEYEDTCYAIIVKHHETGEWCIIRQERDAEIRVNGVSMEWVEQLKSGDRLTFDHSEVTFMIKEGMPPQESYRKYRSSGWIVASFMVVFVLLLGLMINMYQSRRNSLSLFENELGSIYKIEADTLLVISSNDTLRVIPTEHTFVGTGFVTDEGYFVTARHCVEFWLTMEHELRPNFQDIQSDIVRSAIEAETDSTLRVVSKLSIVNQDGICVGRYTSDDFWMDKSKDNLYEYGDFQHQYFWRSVVSLYERTGAELGDVAVMKWKHEEGKIELDEAEKPYEMSTKLCGFGYPQSENKQQAQFAYGDGEIYQKMENLSECFICNTSFDQGFSGGPVFDKERKKVIGLISRSSDTHTLVVPVSQISQLINDMIASKSQSNDFN